MRCSEIPTRAIHPFMVHRSIPVVLWSSRIGCGTGKRRYQMKTTAVPVRRLTADDFAPYGTLVAGGLGEPDFTRPKLENWRLGFASDAPLRLQVMRYHAQRMVISQFERHLCVTETRCPIGGAQGVLVVAGKTDGDAPPCPDTIRAFLIDGPGVMLKPGVWHGLDCFRSGRRARISCFSVTRRLRTRSRPSSLASAPTWSTWRPSSRSLIPTAFLGPCHERADPGRQSA